MPSSYLANARIAGAVFVVLAVSACRTSEPAIEHHEHGAADHAAHGMAAEPPYEHAIIPAPAYADFTHGGWFVLNDSSQIVVDGDEEAMRVGRMLADLIGNTVESMPDVVPLGSEVEGPHIQLILKSDNPDLGTEGYDLVIGSHGVALTAPTAAGLFYGVQTIRQLLPAYVEYTAAFPMPLRLPIGRVTDAPRFAWRGAMLDVARHFLPATDVMRYIDLMALHKLNRLHLHLSDDQGWRIEIRARPRLTEHGGSSQVGGKGGGFYSTKDFAALVRYAQDRFVTIVPEIDMPGHTNAALASYPEINCDGKARDLYTGTEVGFSTVCVEKEETYAFIEDVVRAIAELTPGPYFHVGGDEVEELTPEQYASFMDRAMEIVRARGKQVVGWDDIAEADLELEPGTVVQVWRPQHEGAGASIAEAVAAGARVVLSPADRVYIDMKYDSTTVLGLAWAGYNDIRDSYDWEPAEFVPGVSESAILGVEAPMWAETLGALHEIELMAFPRLAGVAELGWSPPAERSWESYRRRVGQQAPRWTALGVNFYRAPEID
ncbi:MAG TPA: beta-N-acetylhexosaminidase, partial [Rhodothermales bacterium]